VSPAIIVAIVVAIVVGLLAFYVFSRPDSFRVERTGMVSAPPAEVFPYINDFRRWTSWSPWEGLDPNLNRSYTGAPVGKGSVYDWSGNNKAGQGRMEVLDSTPNEKILIDLQFVKPFKARNTTEFTLKPSGSGTQVIWAMWGPNTTMGKVMSLAGGMDAYLGKEFDKGLGNLAAVVQSDAEGRKAKASS